MPTSLQIVVRLDVTELNDTFFGQVVAYLQYPGASWSYHRTIIVVFELRPDSFAPITQSESLPPSAHWTVPELENKLPRRRWLTVLPLIAALFFIVTAPILGLVLVVVSTLADLYIILSSLREPVDRRPASEAEIDKLLNSVPPAWLVCARVLRDGAWVGSSRGIVRFKDRALEFEGDRTSFRIGSQDVLSLQVVKRFGRSRVYRLQLRSRSGLLVVFELLRVPNEKEARSTFLSTLSEFLQTTPTELGRTYPPLTRWRLGEPSQDSLVQLIQ